MSEGKARSETGGKEERRRGCPPGEVKSLQQSCQDMRGGETSQCGQYNLKWWLDPSGDAPNSTRPRAAASEGQQRATSTLGCNLVEYFSIPLRPSCMAMRKETAHRPGLPLMCGSVVMLPDARLSSRTLLVAPSQLRSAAHLATPQSKPQH